MKLMELYARKKKDMATIERALEEQVRSDHDLLNETSLHLLKAGGKRIRPVFVLLAGEFGQYNLEHLKKIAIALELIHMASLVHDDVIDDASTRRGELTVKEKWDNRIAMYTGDFIFAKALMTVTELEDPRVHQILSKAIVEMSLGEMEQIRYFFNASQSIRTYLLRIRRKTALLIAISCQLGAIVSGASEREIQHLYAFGYNIGMAFQIRDDILDINGTEKQLGKPPGSDIRQGNITLPVILALREQGLGQLLKEEISRLKQLDGEADTSDFLAWMRGSEGMKQAEDLANKYISKALDALKKCSNIKARKNLRDIAYFVGNRSY